MAEADGILDLVYDGHGGCVWGVGKLREMQLGC
jgi:hypothetical protein